MGSSESVGGRGRGTPDLALLRRSAVASLLAAGLAGTSLSPGPVRAQESGDVEAVRDVAQAYLDGLLDADTAKLGRAFAPEARLYGVPGRALDVIPVAEWIASRVGEPLRPANEYVHRVVSVDVAGDAASAKVDLVWPQLHYVDYLSFLRIGGEWKIVNKIWHQEPSARALASLETRPLPAGRVAPYLGHYATERGSRFRIVRRNDGVGLRMDGEEYRLYYQGDHTFAPEFDPASRLRFVMEDGRVSEVSIEQEGGSAVATRVKGG